MANRGMSGESVGQRTTRAPGATEVGEARGTIGRDLRAGGDVAAGAPETGAVGASERGRSLQPGLISGVGRSGSRDRGAGLEQACRDEGAVTVRIDDPDIAYEGAVGGAIGRLPLQPDSFPLDQRRIGGGRFRGEAGLADW